MASRPEGVHRATRGVGQLVYASRHVNAGGTPIYDKIYGAASGSKYPHEVLEGVG
jgi:hypothetical protein